MANMTSRTHSARSDCSTARSTWPPSSGSNGSNWNRLVRPAGESEADDEPDSRVSRAAFGQMSQRMGIEARRIEPLRRQQDGAAREYAEARTHDRAEGV